MAWKKLLSRDEEVSLARDWLEDGNEYARARLIDAYYPLIAKTAKKMARPGLDMQDLIQEGTIGFMAGLNNFDPDRGLGVGTLARWHIIHSIQTYIADTAAITRLPNSRRMKNLVSRVIVPIREIEEKCGVKLTAEQEAAICEDEGFKHSDLEEYRAVHAPPQSVEPSEDDEEGGVGLADQCDNPEDSMIASCSLDIARREISEVMASLPEKKQKILALRFFSDERVSLESIARDMGVTRERVRQIEMDAREKIRFRLKARGFRGLDDFF